MKRIANNIIGSGFLANQFKNHLKLIKKLNLCIYASGVSNSLCKNKLEFNRDYKGIKEFVKSIGSKKLVYISSCSVFDPNRNKSSYIKNKIKIEEFIKKNFKYYVILRFPEIIGKNNNRNTLLNFLFYNISNSIKFTAYLNAKRNILDVDDAIKLSFFFFKFKKEVKEINIINSKFFYVSSIIKCIEGILGIKALYLEKKVKFANWKIKSSCNNNILKKNKVKFTKKYLPKIMKKYYI